MIALLATLGICLIAAPGATAGRSALLDPGNDLLVERVFVPTAERPQGEVRIVRRGGRPVVQTLLHTKVLKRVIGAIAEKERRGWPAGGEGHEEAQRYVTALEKFRDEMLARRETAGSDQDRRITALIEFVDAPAAPFVAIGSARIESGEGGMQLLDRETPVMLDLTARYVLRNMRFIVADAFHVTIEEADRMIGTGAGK